VPKPFNLLFIFADQMRGQDMGHSGNPDARTPNMDRLAAEGVTFTNAIANCPVCTPSRGSMLTGLHPLHHGAVANDIPIRPDIPSIGTILRDAGYRTGYIGKWHLDGVPRDRFTPPGPRRLGFDDYWAAWNCHHDYFNGRYFEDTPEPRSFEGYEPDGQTDLAIRFMERYRNDPFLLVLSWGPPHDPYGKVPDEFLKMYDPVRLTLRPNVAAGGNEEGVRRTIASYYAAITALDANLGRLLAALERLGLAETTAVLFTSDHGDMLWSQGYQKKQKPWEESIRVPLIIRAPGARGNGTACTRIVEFVDIYPTLTDLAGLKPPKGLEGRSLQPLLDNPLARWDGHAITQVLRPADKRLAKPVMGRSIRTERWRYTDWAEGNSGVELYDHANDPMEFNNLALEPDPEARVVMQQLRKLLEQKASGKVPTTPFNPKRL